MTDEQSLPFRCADAARGRADPPLGTTPPTHRWLLIEHPGPWRIDALAGSELLGPVQSSLRRPPPRTRVLLIRRVGRSLPRGEHRRHWAVVDTGGQAHWGSWITGTDLEPAADLLEDSRPIEGVTTPLFLVCTHGVHDQCCALRGRPVASALAEDFPDETWECTHLGGDRFAANLLVLPDGVLYGNLAANGVADLVRDHRQGRLALPNLRGFADTTPVGQVALGAVHDRLGPLAYGTVTIANVAEADPDRFRVELLIADGRDVEAIIATSARPPARLTCRAAWDTSALDYSVESLRVVTER